MKSVPIRPRKQTYYDYRGVRFYTVISDGIESPDVEQRRHGYLCLWKNNFTLFDETLENIDILLNKDNDGKWFDHIRREVSQQYDNVTSDWKKDSVHYIAGWDYQHIGDEKHYGRGYKWDGEDDSHIVNDCERAIDSLIRRGIVKEQQ
jgi:hypothetical protein